MFIVALTILFALIFVVIGAGVVYTYRSGLFCFNGLPGKPRYGIVPNEDDEDDDVNVHLQYGDSLDDDYGA